VRAKTDWRLPSIRLYLNGEESGLKTGWELAGGLTGDIAAKSRGLERKVRLLLRISDSDKQRRRGAPNFKRPVPLKGGRNLLEGGFTPVGYPMNRRNGGFFFVSCGCREARGGGWQIWNGSGRPESLGRPTAIRVVNGGEGFWLITSVKVRTKLLNSKKGLFGGSTGEGKVGSTGAFGGSWAGNGGSFTSAFRRKFEKGMPVISGAEEMS